MKSVILSKDPDILTGMRLSGIEGCLVSNRAELMDHMKRLLSDHQTGIIILTRDTLSLAEAEIMEMKLKVREKLIVEIPDFGGVLEDRMSKYIRESIGIKIE